MEAQKKMTITRGLVQLKLLDKRIQKATTESFITYKVGDEVHNPKSTPESALQSVEDLTTQRAKIKSAIMTANAVTEVTIGEETMTIAEAIEKKSTIVYMIDLHKSMTNQLRRTKADVEGINHVAQQRLDGLLETNFGKDMKAREGEIKSITDAFNTSNKAELVDPADLEAKIGILWNKIEEFKSEVDLSLSEINAVTEIDIDMN